IAVRAHPLSPAMVVYHKPEKVDPLAVKLADVEGIPLVTTNLELDELVERLEAIE
ncbi:MAG TPA: transcriptional regulator, partial [Candidatus Methanomethylophilaceae archaeon]|nr:transcriptional regulator [Candidatus Methanomethylophilaceae archaeon]